MESRTVFLMRVPTRSREVTLHRSSARQLAALGLVGSAGVVLAIACGSAQPNASGSQATSGAGPAACANGDESAWLAQMNTYGEAGEYAAVQEQSGDAISSVLVEVPAIEFSGEGQSSTLPIGPCQFIYRYKYSEVQAATGSARPFAYVEIDWNTEGEPRGPNGAFLSPHFDFHFYLPPRSQVDNDLACVSSNGKTCDGFLTDYDQMRRFQMLPDAPLVPELYRPDVGSAIPAMGMHMLDMTVDYTVDSVNHYPVLIYGSYDGELVFAESSVTLYTLQDAVNAPDHRLVFPYRQPAAFATDIDWPTEFVIEFLPESGGFQVGFQTFVHRTASAP
jgi:hypothetical protein